MSADMFTPQESKAIALLKKSLTELLRENLLSLTLFGSRARGDFDRQSDIDIAIIVRDLTSAQKNRILSAIAEIEYAYTLPLAALVLSEKDFSALRHRERRIARDILEEGVPL